jgi:uncharacterized membrane protein
MEFFQVVILYFITLAIGFVIDLAWLGLMNSRFYKPQLAGLMSDKVNWLPGILFYVLFVFGLLALVVIPAFNNESWLSAMLLGGLLGMIAYGTYDLTNLASIKNWPIAVTIVDIVWGTTLAATVATISYFIAGAIS